MHVNHHFMSSIYLNKNLLIIFTICNKHKQERFDIHLPFRIQRYINFLFDSLFYSFNNCIEKKLQKTRTTHQTANLQAC